MQIPIFKRKVADSMLLSSLLRRQQTRYSPLTAYNIGMDPQAAELLYLLGIFMVGLLFIAWVDRQVNKN
jgi:hypothetical protein